MRTNAVAENIVATKAKPKEVLTRQISREAERELWARSAGRCEFPGCNRILYRSSVTNEPVTLGERAHIYSFSQVGPRGWGPFGGSKEELNNLSNLLLVCHECHKTIDQDHNGIRYTADLLRTCKEQHERRVEIVTGICPDKKSHVVLYGAKIGEEGSPLRALSAFEAMFPERYPAEERCINLAMASSLDDHDQGYWIAETEHLRKSFNREIRPLAAEAADCHFSLFALAPQPLLVLLGTLFSDKTPVEVYQLHREPPSWKYQSHPEGFQFDVRRPSDTKGEPVLALSLSGRIDRQRITAVLGEGVSIWELTVEQCHNDFLRSQAQLSMFRESARKLMVSISEAHGLESTLRIFPAMLVACAVELGRIRMPKVDMPWVIYEQNQLKGGFFESLTIGGRDE